MSRSVTDPRLCFNAEYFDTLAAITRNLQVLFFYEDCTVEITDTTTHKSFLKRCPCENLTKEMFFLGARVVIFGRVIKLIEYGDRVTEQLCESLSQETVVVIGSTLFPQLGRTIETILVELQFTLRGMHMLNLPSTAASEYGIPESFCGPQKQALVMDLVGINATKKATSLPERLKSADVWATPNRDAVQLAAPLLQNERKYSCAVQGLGQGMSAVVVLKPHVVQDGLGGEILQRLLSNGSLRLTALSLFTLSAHNAEEFLAAYKGVLEDYRDTVIHMASGPLWVSQWVSASQPDLNVVETVRELVGPFDPVIAKHLRPKTIRGLYGVDRVKNAAHCSDLENDGACDTQFFFSTLKVM